MPRPRLIRDDPQQDELAFSSVLSHSVFPNRTVLTCAEVAKVTGFTARHIADLCEEGTIAAFNGAGENNPSNARFWRIPVSAYDEWIKRRSNAQDSRSFTFS